uniref:Uncharacterized protein n=1 Tax=Rhizophora mucronata TaxID=61149 RepID=A0A2P2QW16_RHIMU
MVICRNVFFFKKIVSALKLIACYVSHAIE